MRARGAVFDAALSDPPQEATLRRLNRLAYWLDERFRLPGTRFRVGIDGLIGLIPAIGDAAGGVISSYILFQAWRFGVPRSVLARMVANILIDVALGSVPVVGDLFDMRWKANRRNVNLLVRYLEDVGRRGHQGY